MTYQVILAPLREWQTAEEHVCQSTTQRPHIHCIWDGKAQNNIRRAEREDKSLIKRMELSRGFLSGFTTSMRVFTKGIGLWQHICVAWWCQARQNNISVPRTRKWISVLIKQQDVAVILSWATPAVLRHLRAVSICRMTTVPGEKEEEIKLVLQLSHTQCEDLWRYKHTPKICFSLLALGNHWTSSHWLLCLYTQTWAKQQKPEPLKLRHTATTAHLCSGWFSEPSRS